MVGTAQLEAARRPVDALLGAAAVTLGLLEGSTVRFVGGPPPQEKAIWQTVSQVLETRVSADAALAGAARVHVTPIAHGGRVHGVLLLRREAAELSAVDRALTAAMAGQLGVAITAELAQTQLELLLRRTLPDDVVRSHIAAPGHIRLGGEVRVISALFADLRGFTSYAERYPPEEVVAMLNRYFELAVPIFIDHGGTITSFIGDAIMAIFNAPVTQSEHALLATRAGLALQEAIRPEAASHQGWPLFRVGIHTGPALVGTVGSAQRSTYTAIGDTVNVAARLEGQASAGEVVISAACRDALPVEAEVAPLGLLQVKGREQPVDAMVLRALRAPAPQGSQTTALSRDDMAALRAEAGRRAGTTGDPG